MCTLGFPSRAFFPAGFRMGASLWPSHYTEPQHMEFIPAGPGDTEPAKQSCQAAETQVPPPPPSSSRFLQLQAQPTAFVVTFTLLPDFCLLPTASPPSHPPPTAPVMPAAAPHFLSVLMASHPFPWPSLLNPARAQTPRYMVSSGRQDWGQSEWESELHH